MKFYLPFLLLFAIAKAQTVGIGTNMPSQGYALDVKANNIQRGIKVRSDSISIDAVSTYNFGIYGESKEFATPAIYGFNSNMGIGVQGSGAYVGLLGFSQSGWAVRGGSSSGVGVDAYSNTGVGVIAHSASNLGLSGSSNSGTGIDAYSETGIGLSASTNSNTNYAILGEGFNAIKAFSTNANGHAGYFSGAKTYIEKLGVGVLNPVAPLHVAGSNILNSGLGYYYGAGFTGAAITSINPGSWATGLFVEYDIVSQRSVVSAQNVTSSDVRIKNIIGRSNGAVDLKTLQGIEVTDYTFKDVVRMGNKQQKKIVAQQLEKVFPEAISIGTSFLPDIYSLATIALDVDGLIVTLNKPHTVQKGDMIKIIDPESGEFEVEIKKILSEKSFLIESNRVTAKKNLFIYGKKVDDFRFVDYEALAVLNISATQELIRQMEGQEKSWRQEKDLLNERIRKIENILVEYMKKESINRQ